VRSKVLVNAEEPSLTVGLLTLARASLFYEALPQKSEFSLTTTTGSQLCPNGATASSLYRPGTW
jgi:hypothetical protein